MVLQNVDCNRCLFLGIEYNHTNLISNYVNLLYIHFRFAFYLQIIRLNLRILMQVTT